MHMLGELTSDRGTRVLVAHWFDWSAIAGGLKSDLPAAVVAASRVVALTPAGRAQGLTLGMRKREAQARCPELSIVRADPGRDARAWESVVAAIEALMPSVQVLSPGALAVPIKGPSRYYGGDGPLADRVRKVAEETVGKTGCWVGVADGLFAARLAAGGIAVTGGIAVAGEKSGTLPCDTGGSRWPEGGVTIVPPGASQKWLGPMPLATLGVGYENLVDLLYRLGLRRLSDLSDLPVGAVLARFGPQGIAAYRLARGLDDNLVQVRVPPADLTFSAELDPPEVKVEAVTFVVKSLADKLVDRLRSTGLVVTAVSIEAHTDQGERSVRQWRHDEAFSASALAERARWQIEGWLSGRGLGKAGGSPVLAGGSESEPESNPTAGIVLLRIVPEEVRQDKGRQLDLWGISTDGDLRASRAIARVQAMLGSEEVKAVGFRGGREVHEQFQLVPWGAPRGHEPVLPWPGRISRPYPGLVHEPPLEVDLLDDCGVSVSVDARGFLDRSPAVLVVSGGSTQPVVKWAGPWPLEERWWHPVQKRRRARMQLIVARGEAHLVFRESARWWLEATYA